ncbi:hypothetical protein FAK_07220 [Desulfoferula mesophila]|uniref:Uncharacterized protein n=1 Tax=Desulfoferula mesophila TaxID=3058419 RepID=A0AAU9ESU8_9BACT|nr:hypothetical protein FAK_07220 [Desulfoferula mesophilus]
MGHQAEGCSGEKGTDPSGAWQAAKNRLAGSRSFRGSPIDAKASMAQAVQSGRGGLPPRGAKPPEAAARELIFFRKPSAI